MTGEINKKGYLSILRRERLKEQFCPFQVMPNVAQLCGDDCPLFQEQSIDAIGAFDKDEQIVSLRCSPQTNVISITKDERE